MRLSGFFEWLALCFDGQRRCYRRLRRRGQALKGPILGTITDAFARSQFRAARDRQTLLRPTPIFSTRPEVTNDSGVLRCSRTWTLGKLPPWKGAAPRFSGKTRAASALQLDANSNLGAFDLETGAGRCHAGGQYHRGRFSVLQDRPVPTRAPRIESVQLGNLPMLNNRKLPETPSCWCLARSRGTVPNSPFLQLPRSPFNSVVNGLDRF